MILAWCRVIVGCPVVQVQKQVMTFTLLTALIQAIFGAYVDESWGSTVVLLNILAQEILLIKGIFSGELKVKLGQLPVLFDIFSTKETEEFFRAKERKK